MAALGRMPPKPHEDMKLGKASGKPNKSHGAVRVEGSIPIKRGRKPKGERALTAVEQTRKSRAELKATRHKSATDAIKDGKRGY